MALLVTNKVIKDQWHILEDDAQIDGGDNMIVSVERWQRDRDDLIACNRDLGIVLKSDQPPNLIEKDIQRFSVICLEFPKFTDGRAYSYARLLRNKYGFKGELRAVGNVLRDQLAFMLRCGIDAFEIADNVNARDWSSAFGEITVRYQGANDIANIVRPNIIPPHNDVAGNWSY